ncbi:hypothetical protein EW026_g4706 [Hermanssonia centrifuga]|uniref:Uncharacterized protein n=1 Tax=Hermanssonia centrifuga TaxID=98765 RepID=A0A4S4KGB7_9APHY|nr:hypothetical protein EW026_g4706 [Hermanssonia centrifuga]
MNNHENDSFGYPTGTPRAPSTPNNNTCPTTPIYPYYYATPSTPQAPTDTTSGEPDTVSSRKRKPKRTEEDKLEYMLGALNQLSWTLGDFLYMIFRVADNQGQKVTRSRRHAAMVSRFLGGTSRHTAGEILKAWLRDPCGKPNQDADEYSAMFTSTVAYYELKHARVAITAAATQLVEKELEREIRMVTRSDSGLHGSGVSPKGKPEICWNDIGPATVSNVKNIINRYQPLTWDIVNHLVTPPSRVRGGVQAVRKIRPPDLVRSLSWFHVISILTHITDIYGNYQFYQLLTHLFCSFLARGQGNLVLCMWRTASIIHVW